MTEPILLPELARLGYIEGKNLVVERRSGGGRRESYPDVAREVVALKPDVIFATSGRMAEACRSITSTIPIVTMELLRFGGGFTAFAHTGNSARFSYAIGDK